MSAVRTYNTHPLIHTVENSNRGWQNTLCRFIYKTIIFSWNDLSFFVLTFEDYYTLFIACAGCRQLFQVVSRPAVKEQIWENDNATNCLLSWHGLQVIIEKKLNWCFLSCRSSSYRRCERGNELQFCVACK